MSQRKYLRQHWKHQLNMSPSIPASLSTSYAATVRPFGPPAASPFDPRTPSILDLQVQPLGPTDPSPLDPRTPTTPALQPLPPIKLEHPLTSFTHQALSTLRPYRPPRPLSLDPRTPTTPDPQPLWLTTSFLHLLTLHFLQSPITHFLTSYVLLHVHPLFYKLFHKPVVLFL